MAVVAFKAPVKRSAKIEAEIGKIVEYRKWRDLIHNEIMAYRKKGGTYKTISARTGLCVSTISKLASKETVLPRMDTVMRILIFLGYKIFAEKVA